LHLSTLAVHCTLSSEAAIISAIQFVIQEAQPARSLREHRSSGESIVQKLSLVVLVVIAAAAVQARAAMVTYNLVVDSPTTFHITVTDDTTQTTTHSTPPLTGNPSNAGLQAIGLYIESANNSFQLKWDTPRAAYNDGENHGFTASPTDTNTNFKLTWAYKTLSANTLYDLSNYQDTSSDNTFVYGYGTAAGGSFPTTDTDGGTLDGTQPTGFGPITFSGVPTTIADGTFAAGDTITISDVGAGVWATNSTTVPTVLSPAFGDVAIANASTTPEPASLVLLSVGGLLILRRRRSA
jgi:hypothetical protein